MEFLFGSWIILNVFACGYILIKVTGDGLFEDGFQVKHLFLFTVCLPSVVIMAVVYLITFVILTICDKLADTFNKRLF